MRPNPDPNPDPRTIPNSNLNRDEGHAAGHAEGRDAASVKGNLEPLQSELELAKAPPPNLV